MEPDRKLTSVEQFMRDFFESIEAYASDKYEEWRLDDADLLRLFRLAEKWVAHEQTKLIAVG